MQRLILKVTLRDIAPPIWRRLDVPADISLAQFHRILQIAMGWHDEHLHQFERGRDIYGTSDREFGVLRITETSTRLGSLLSAPKDKLTYLYDFGDSWTHLIVVERTADDGLAEMTPATVVAGKRACPPEDSGGSWGYENLLAALNDPTHPDHTDLTEWVGGPFDSERFGMVAINRRLARLKLRATAPGRTSAGIDTPHLDHKLIDFFKRRGRP